MVRLKAEPPMPVRSMEELLAIGHAIKVEAAGRYAELSERMQAAGNGSVAAVFQRLSRDAHEDMLSIELQAQTSLGAAPNPRAMRWALPSILDEEAAGELASSRIVTPYRALSVAVRDAEQAFMLWSYLAAQTESTEVRHAAEARAQLELDRVASLRRDRRKAYHLEHPPIGARASSDTRNDADISLAALEERMADMLQQLAQAGAQAAVRPAATRRGGPLDGRDAAAGARDPKLHFRRDHEVDGRSPGAGGAAGRALP